MSSPYWAGIYTVEAHRSTLYWSQLTTCTGTSTVYGISDHRREARDSSFTVLFLEIRLVWRISIGDIQGGSRRLRFRNGHICQSSPRKEVVWYICVCMNTISPTVLRRIDADTLEHPFQENAPISSLGVIVRNRNYCPRPQRIALNPCPKKDPIMCPATPSFFVWLLYSRGLTKPLRSFREYYSVPRGMRADVDTILSFVTHNFCVSASRFCFPNTLTCWREQTIKNETNLSLKR